MQLRKKDIERANMTRDLRQTPWSNDPERNLREVMAELSDARFKLVEKRRIEPANDMTTTMTSLRQIRVARGFFERPLKHRVATLAHELVHVRQRVRVFTYIDPRYRFATECPAYRETIRVVRAHGESEKGCRDRIEVIIDKLRSRYLVGVMDTEHVQEQIRKVLLLGIHDDERLRYDVSRERREG